MQEPSRKKVPTQTHRLYEQPQQEPGSYYWPPMNHQGLYSDDVFEQNRLPSEAFKQYCNLESSSGTSTYPPQNSSSTASFASNGSPSSHQECLSYPLDPYYSPDNNCGSPVSRSCLTDDAIDNLRHKIRELETAMLGPDEDLDIYSITNPVHPELPVPEVEWKDVSEIITRKDLKEMLCACARAIGDNDMLTGEWLVSELRGMVSVFGKPIQRLGAYMLEALVARTASSGSSIYKALRCKEPIGAELLSYMHILYEVCPYFKFGYLSGNGAIAEAIKGENRVHIIDFQIAQGNQWITLIQALANRPRGPPKITITGIDDSASAFARGGGLDIVGKRLSLLAESLMVPFEFHGIAASVSEVQREDLKVQPGEAIAVNFALVLHHIPDETVGSQNHRDRILRLVKGLSPKVVTLVEHESNTNTAPFYPRFVQTLKYYTAIFESIDVTLSREHKERINVEQHCLARDIVNIIACEGAERVERHELLEKWRSRFLTAGFKPHPLSPFVNATIEALLKNYCDKYTLEEKDGALYLGWLNQNLVTSSAWI
ncbi:scarecrow-like transcription factor PAT1 [Momordica charantia]|uniref:Scarecrow-like transcription factor PAT1 n=1 Tax=Momordica charantia TaxID=3673 RepID=A0A6J1DN57_MOMCH|nr:scarecrow-like transcription factor PAT1 [Momordica charantia]XP_022154982.1 scarecrow-like transcription factor PAT1 [Momordica charantia]XP_022154983.1 scarecrow-like transcription factor PAT1 [Momordica charantia]XP_022154984.1 scarecrow-like transcription factor PAT1 [Momordica charantia]